jgi:hypothetical protein
MTIAETQAAFEAGYQAAQERQDFYTSRPGEGVRLVVDDPPASPGSVGLGYRLPPPPIPIYVADSPGLTPQVLPVPVPDVDVPPSLSGATHGGYAPAYYAAARADAGPVTDGRASRSRRRGLISWLLGRGA